MAFGDMKLALPAVDVLVLTSPDDFHTYAVAEALQRKGASVALWHTTDFPSLQLGSVYYDQHVMAWEMAGPDFMLSATAPFAIWIRRPEPSVLPAGIAPPDQKFALRECRHFLAGLLRGVGAQSFCVNPLGSFGRSSLKMEQLRAAREAGLAIPPTLLSNDPEKIRIFLRDHDTIYKAFSPVSWKKSDAGLAVLFTSVVTEEDLPDDSMIQAAPGIFQAKVPKAFEIRVTAFGDHMIAARLDSQEVPSAVVDWRAGGLDVPVHGYSLPDAVSLACRCIMADLGIIFGCFDLIVTPSGEHVFLEVNEMGAFLWLEEQNPELLLLDAFCELLLQKKADFNLNGSRRRVRFQEVRDEAIRRKTEAVTRHVASLPETVDD